MAQIPYNLKHIEAFLAVADLGSFRRAADRLNTTQPNISNRISQFEERLGQRLLERDAGSVRLTPRGQALLGPARQVLAAADGLVSAAGDTTIFRGVLRLGVSEMVAGTWLRAFMQDMKAQFPGIDIDLTVDLSANLSRALFARDLDLTLQSGPFLQTATHTVALGQSAYAWVGAPGLGVPDTPLDAAQVTRHPVLTHSRGTVPQRQLQDHFHAIGQPVRLVSASNISTCLQLALDGLGIACLPVDLLSEPLEQGRLRRLHYGWVPEDLVFAARSLMQPEPAYVTYAMDLARRLYPPLA